MGETGIGSIGGYGSEVRYQPGRFLKQPGLLLAPTSNDETSAALRELLARQVATREAWNVASGIIATSSDIETAMHTAMPRDQLFSQAYTPAVLSVCAPHSQRS